MSTYSTAKTSATAAPVIPDMTVPEFVLGQAYEHGGKRALVEAGTGREVTYAQLAAAVRGTAAWLAAQGVCPGDVLALCAPNSIEFAITSYAAMTAGAILTTINPIASREEVVYQLRQTGARWLVTTSDLFAPKLEGRRERPESPRPSSSVPMRHRAHDGSRCSGPAARPERRWLISALPMSRSCRLRAEPPGCPRASC